MATGAAPPTLARSSLSAASLPASLRVRGPTGPQSAVSGSAVSGASAKTSGSLVREAAADVDPTAR